MGFASDSLDLVRRVFRRDQMIPGVPAAAQPSAVAGGRRGMSYAGGMLSMISGGVTSQMQDALTIDNDLVSRLADYDEMDSFPEIATALDLYADDATVQDVLDGQSLWYEAPDEQVSEILQNMLTKQLRAEEDLYDLTREACKSGNNYTELVVVDGLGVVEMREIDVPAVRRVQDDDGILYGFIYDPNLGFTISTDDFFNRVDARTINTDGQRIWGPYQDQVRVYEPWEMVHFRMRGRNASDMYGLSIVDAARYAWRRLMMMEDAMLLYKLTRSPQRYAFYVDVGDGPPREARRLLEQVKTEFKKTKFIGEDGKPDFRYNPLSADEDLFIASRKDKRTTEVEVLSGPEGQQTDDVEYFKEKLILSLKVPKSYLAGDDTVGRANLAQLDVRMARSVMRVQRVIKNGYDHVARVDLAAKNIDPDIIEFKSMMNIPSGVLELAQVEVQKAKLDLADSYRSAGFSDYWIWSTVLGMSDDEIAKAKAQPEAATFEGRARAERVIKAGLAAERSRAASMLNETKAQAALREIRVGQTETARRVRQLGTLMHEIRRSMPKQQKFQQRRRK